MMFLRAMLKRYGDESDDDLFLNDAQLPQEAKDRMRQALKENHQD